MDTHKFFVEKLRFHLYEKTKLIFTGWFFDGSMDGHRLEVSLDGEILPLALQINRGAEVRQKYLRSINEIKEEIVGTVTLPQNWRDYRKLTIVSSYDENKGKALSVSTRKLGRLEQEICYYIENCHRGDGKIRITGWCMADGETKLSLLDATRQPLPIRTNRYYRKDLLPVFPDYEKEGKPGFLVETEVKEENTGPFFLEIRNANVVTKIKLKKWDEGTKLQYIAEKISDTIRYLKRNGFTATVYKINSKLRKKEVSSYDSWQKKYTVKPEELEEQRKKQFEYPVKFSVIVPLYRTNPDYLKEMIESILAQTYENWQLCMACADSPELLPLLEAYHKQDERIVYCSLKENGGISLNTNAALELAEGDYVVLADHDDIVPANALYEFAAAIDKDRTIDVLYSDEDKISMDGKRYFEPHFKPDFNLDMLCSVNYICHLFAVKKEVINLAGNFKKEYDGAQDLDFILRCTEVAKQICHVPKILYHWRCHIDSTAANPESKLYAYEAGKKAIEAHYKRLSIPATVENAQFYGVYRTHYHWEETPLVSIIIPNKDHAADLAKCLNSIYEKSEYRNFEVIVVENNSVEPETFAYYKKLQAEKENVEVVYYEGGFNYSKINNFGAAAAKGDYFLLLNNDTELINGDCIKELLGYCMREDVGVVGAKLLYEDETIQHAGVVAGFGGTAGHAFIGKARYDTGYFGRILIAQDYSAVTAACLMTKRTTFEAVGGLSEELAVAFNDVDYCLKVRKLGKLVVYNPYAELFHYESKSRGYEDSPEKVERFNGEVEILLSHWRTLIEQGDPYYNPNLTLDNSDFSLRK